MQARGLEAFVAPEGGAQKFNGLRVYNGCTLSTLKKSDTPTSIAATKDGLWHARNRSANHVDLPF